jgi:hypothetical protein
MRRPRPRLVLLTVVTAGLLLSAHLAFNLALLDIVWRTSVLSWDSPTTQLLDEMASQAAPATEATEGPESPVVQRARALLPDRPERLSGSDPSGPATRAPPSV